jgi:MFS family permease
VLLFTGVACLVGFFHPGLAPLLAFELLGPSPLALGIFTSVIAAGSISGGVLLQRRAAAVSRRPGLLLGACTLVSGLAQLGLSLHGPQAWGLAMAFLIGAGTACLLAGTNLIIQVHAPQVLRGRMAGLGQIAFLGGGGLSGLAAAGLIGVLPGGLWGTLALLGGLGALLGLVELWQQRRLRLGPASLS